MDIYHNLRKNGGDNVGSVIVYLIEGSPFFIGRKTKRSILFIYGELTRFQAWGGKSKRKKKLFR